MHCRSTSEFASIVLRVGTNFCRGAVIIPAGRIGAVIDPRSSSESMPESPAQSHLFTIGHSNHEWETFLALLKQHGIDCIADVRSSPFSAYASHFDAPKLKNSLRDAGIAFVPLGRELGGRPEDEAMYDPTGRVYYGLVAKSAIFLEGIERLERGCRDHRVALMCAEENPTECHRHLLVSRVLTDRGTAVTHIRGDGETASYEKVEHERSGGGNEKQSLLFPESEEDEWKSIRSVLRKSRPRSSSES